MILALHFEHITPILKQLCWMPVKDHLFYRDALLTFMCRTVWHRPTLVPETSRGTRLAAARLATKINWTYRAIKPLRVSEAFYTMQ